MHRYGLTILLSAFLLFLVQPLVAKKLLPELGGTSTIWTTCMMFFQVALFVGYLYAHLLRSFFKPVAGWMIHCVVIVFAIVWLRIQPFPNSHSATGELSWAVTTRLISMIGLPFIVLASTSPLVQAWHSVSHPGQRTYRLYALSNLGSLIALLSYPFAIDPFIGIAMQTQIWSVGFIVFVTAMVVCGLQMIGESAWPNAGTNNEVELTVGRHSSTSILTVMFWFALSANGSILLIATSNILCQEVASFPFLWLLPLICYLLTLIICFDWPGLYQRWFFQPVFAASCFLAIIVYHFGINIGLIGQSIGCGAALTSGCMICHGELVRLRPGVERLTNFYLAVAFGGAIGGIFAVVVAPRIFNRFFEFHLALFGTLLFSAVLYSAEHFRKKNANTRHLYLFLFTSGLAAVPVACSLYYYLDPALNKGILFEGRNDYGLISVKETENYRIMKSGSTNHGGQFLAEDKLHQPFAYYSDGSGAQQAFAAVRSVSDRPGQPLKIGVIGLGTGSLLSHGRPADLFRFYEINPIVEHVAMEYFRYLPAENAQVVIGDGRIELQRELNTTGSNNFDILFLDAFSSDSIPSHLLTTECFALYLKHLRPNGIVVAHITNKFVDLKPVLASIAKLHDLYSVRVEHENEEFKIVTDWVLLTRSADVLNESNFDVDQLQWMQGLDEWPWTDDNSSVLPLVKWGKRFGH